ncbi:beta-1,4-N-acetylgalactosaminyltransferase bre-4-like [Ixodes scapularis]|uniref:beta-1,4-N-acetylgalactosaminyltransferase bre-4-like n=1 Tax=Ixodes scapularis TaxID=6945 RepID=UPI001A9D8E65|nr:beta-1,4-N-acetylgalactosaminyltransferase bre-4-like [Ixodes scapularis]
MSSCKMFNPCCSNFYKVLAVILAALLLLEYSFNLLVYHQKNIRFLNASVSSIFEPLLSADSEIFNASLGNRTRGGVESTGNGTGRSNTRAVAVSSNTSLELCPLMPPNLVGRRKVLQQAPSLEDIEKNFTHIMPGGRFKPKECLARHRVAILIPYRNREEHLRVFLYNMHQFLPRQQIDYGIFVIEQEGNGKFNRAKLLNVGYLETQGLYDCLILHDVDLIPEDDRNLYTCPEQPRHMSVAMSTMNYTLPYTEYFGGVSALNKKHMELVNGFSNQYWGWGAEDDDMFCRLAYSNLNITRYPAEIARYTMLGHAKETPSPERLQLLSSAKSRYKSDGLNSVDYERKALVLKKLYTWILADLKSPDWRPGFYEPPRDLNISAC